MGFAFGCVSAVTKSEFNDLPGAISMIFPVLAVLTMFCTLYTMMVFALCSMYGKTGLGVGKDTQYDEFIEDTLKYRQWAFSTFVISIWCCGALMMFTLLLKVPSIYVLLVTPFALVCSFALYANLKNLMAVAARTIFMPTLVEPEGDGE